MNCLRISLRYVFRILYRDVCSHGLRQGGLAEAELPERQGPLSDKGTLDLTFLGASGKEAQHALRQAVRKDLRW